MARSRKTPAKKIVEEEEEDLLLEDEDINSDDLDDIDVSDVESEDEEVQEEDDNEEEEVPDDEEETPSSSSGKRQRSQKPRTPEKAKRQTKMAEKGKKSYRLISDSIQPLGDTPPFEESMTRTLTKNGSGQYTILNLTKNRFTGKNPIPAAKKVASKINKCYNPDNEISFTFSIKETTQGSKNDVYHYVCEMKKLNKPKTIVKGDTEYIIRFDPKIRAYKPSKEDQDEAPTDTKPVKKSTTTKSSTTARGRKSTTRGRNNETPTRKTSSQSSSSSSSSSSRKTPTNRGGRVRGSNRRVKA